MVRRWRSSGVASLTRAARSDRDNSRPRGAGPWPVRSLPGRAVGRWQYFDIEIPQPLLLVACANSEGCASYDKWPAALQPATCYIAHASSIYIWGASLGASSTPEFAFPRWLRSEISE